MTKVVILSKDEDKASAFYSYFSSVFTIDDGATNNVDDVENEILKETNVPV